MASAVELQALLEAASGERIGRQSDASTNFMALLDRVMLKLHAETDPVQAAAIRQITHAEAPIRNGS